MKLFVKLILFGLGPALEAQAAPNVIATVDDNQILLSETVTFRITAENSDEYPRADLSQLKDFTVISGPAQSTSMHWINGKVSSSRSLSWTLIPNDTGSLEIPALSVGLGAETFLLDPITVTVFATASGRQGAEGRKGQIEEKGPPAVYLEARANKKEVFRGEQITVQYRLYTRLNLQQYSVQKKPQGVGFWQEVLFAPTQPTFRDTQVEGVRYRVATVYEIALFPTTDGDLKLEPMIVEATVRDQARTRLPSPFDDFFSDPFSSRTRRQVVHSPGLDFSVKPVPLAGLPDHYTGAVGQFSLSASLDTHSTRVDEAVAYTLELKGTGNLGLFQLEIASFPVGLEVFEPKITFEKDPFRDEVSGTRTWKYIVIPRKPGRYLLPETRLAYFDPRTVRYEIASAHAHPLTVLEGDLVYDEGKGLTKEEVALLSQDIRYIRTRPVRLKQLNRPTVPGTFWMLTVAGMFLFFGPGAVKIVQSNRQERMDDIRARKALRMARKRLGRIQDPKAFDKISRTISAYFSDRMKVPSSGLDARELRRLIGGIVGDETVSRLSEVLAICDQARYAPSEAGGEWGNAVMLAAETSEILEKVDRQL